MNRYVCPDLHPVRMRCVQLCIAQLATNNKAKPVVRSQMQQM